MNPNKRLKTFVKLQDRFSTLQVEVEDLEAQRAPISVIREVEIERAAVVAAMLKAEPKATTMLLGPGYQERRAYYAR